MHVQRRTNSRAAVDTGEWRIGVRCGTYSEQPVSGMRQGSGPAAGSLECPAQIVPFTIGLNAINGSSAVPLPKVLTKFGPVMPGPGYRVGHWAMAFVPCSAM